MVDAEIGIYVGDFFKKSPLTPQNKNIYNT